MLMDILGGIIEMIIGLVEGAVELAFGIIEVVFGLVGGVTSLIFSAFGVVLLIALVAVFFHRRGKQRAQQKSSGVLVDENGETFTSFYHQQNQE